MVWGHVDTPELPHLGDRSQHSIVLQHQIGPIKTLYPPLFCKTIEPLPSVIKELKKILSMLFIYFIHSTNIEYGKPVVYQAL